MTNKWIITLMKVVIMVCSAGCQGQAPLDILGVKELATVPYESARLGISSVVPADWVPFWPEELFRVYILPAVQ